MRSLEIRDGAIHGFDTRPPKNPGEAGVRVLDANGAFLLPGWIDAHAHLDTLPSLGSGLKDLDFLTQVLPSTARSTLASGVTAARIHLSRFEHLAVLNELSSDPCFPGPRLQLAGPGLLGGVPDVTSPLMVGAGSPEQIAAHMYRAADLVARWIALHGISRFDDSQMATIQEVAAGADLLLMAAADSEADLERALETSVRTLEYLDRSTAERLSPELVQRAAGKVAVVPPVGYYELVHDLFRERRANESADPFLREIDESLPTRIVEALQDGVRADSYSRQIAESFPTHSAKFRQLREGGVDLLLGSDSGSPGQYHGSGIWTEIGTWQRFGESSRDIAMTAAARAAHWLDWPDIGEIRVGARADVVLYGGDSAPEIQADQIRHVVKGGVVFVEDGEWVGPNTDETVELIRAAAGRAESSLRSVRRRYCTRIGSFDVVFRDDQVVGNYLILPRNRLGNLLWNLREQPGPCSVDRLRWRRGSPYRLLA